MTSCVNWASNLFDTQNNAWVGGIQESYRDHKQCQLESFEKDFVNSCFNGEFETYEKNFLEGLNNHAPKKVKVIREKEKPHLNKTLRKL